MTFFQKGKGIVNVFDDMIRDYDVETVAGESLLNYTSLPNLDAFGLCVLHRRRVKVDAFHTPSQPLKPDKRCSVPAANLQETPSFLCM